MPVSPQSPAPENPLAGYCVVIPALDPPTGLEQLALDLDNAGFRKVVVVDDGSATQSPTLARTGTIHGVQLLRYPSNRGKGFALRTGIEAALRDPETLGVVTADADGQHAAADIVSVGLELAAAEASGQSSLVLGTRNFREESAAVVRHNRFVRAMLKMLLGRSPQDTICGLRGLPRVAAESALEVAGDHFDYELRLLVAMLSSGMPMREVPISSAAESTPSGFRPGLDTIRNCWILLRQFFGFISTSLLGALVDLAVYSFLIIVVFAPQSVGDVALSVVIARVVSSLVNFALNRRLVFSHQGSAKRAMLRYYVLVVLLLVASASGTSLVGWLTGGHVIWAKILVDAALFLVSYLSQRRWVFNGQSGDE